MKPFSSLFKELSEKSIRINRFQQLDTEIVQIKQCNTKVSRSVLTDRAKFSAQGIFKKGSRGIDTVHGNADVIEPTDGFIRHLQAPMQYLTPD